jgi:hypothetical protein
MEDLEKLLDECYDKVHTIPGVYSLYLFDLQYKKIEYKIIDQHHNKSKSYEVLRKVVSLFKDEAFDMLFIDVGERIFIHRISNNVILMVTSNKEVPLGKLVTLIKSIRG